jgi:antitoxin component of RelBE/YafQ-DinJ toxin-antitoxin module
MYQLLKDRVTNQTETTVKRTIDNAFIPFDLANTDYQEYLKWIEEGNEPLPAENT